MIKRGRITHIILIDIAGRHLGNLMGVDPDRDSLGEWAVVITRTTHEASFLLVFAHVSVHWIVTHVHPARHLWSLPTRGATGRGVPRRIVGHLEDRIEEAWVE